MGIQFITKVDFLHEINFNTESETESEQFLDIDTHTK